MYQKIFYGVLILSPFVYIYLIAQEHYGFAIGFPVSAILLIIFGVRERKNKVLSFWLGFVGGMSILFFLMFTGGEYPPRRSHTTASIKANLTNIRVLSEEYKKTQPYISFCTDNKILESRQAAENAGNMKTKCFNDADSWVITGKITKEKNYWCVDSTGKSHAITPAQESLITTADTLCSS